MWVLTIALSAGVYALGLLGSLPDAFASPIWPATGFQIAMYFRFGKRALWAMLPGILIIQLQLGLKGGLPLIGSAVFAIVSASAMATEAVITKRLTRPPSGFGLDRSAFIRFAAYAAPLGAASSAVQGATVLAMYNAYPAQIDWYLPYIVWWSGNLIGAYVLVPLLTLNRQQLQELTGDAVYALIYLIVSLAIVSLAAAMDSLLARQFLGMLLLIILYSLIRRQTYPTMVFVLSTSILALIALLLNRYTVEANGASIYQILALKLQIGMVMCGSVYLFMKLESEARLAAQVEADKMLLQQRVDDATLDLQQEVAARKSEEEAARSTTQLLQAIGDIRTDFLEDQDPHGSYGRLLDRLLELTDSEYGFVGELLREGHTHKPYLKMYAISNLSWDDHTIRLYERLEKNDFEFHTLDNLIGLAIRSGEPVTTESREDDPRARALPRGHPEIRSFVGIPITYGGITVGEIGLANRGGGFDQEFLTWLDPVVKSLGQLIQARWNQASLEAAEDALRRIAVTDSLTGLSNRRRFEPVLEHALKQAHRHGHPLCLLMMDLDHFKKVNDDLGHEAGDQVLREVANAFRAVVRDADHICRWGGEEFLLLATHSDLASAMDLGERIRRNVENHVAAGQGRATISIGVAEWERGESADRLLARADEAMYAAKRNGRNRVESAIPSVED